MATYVSTVDLLPAVHDLAGLNALPASAPAVQAGTQLDLADVSRARKETSARECFCLHNPAAVTDEEVSRAKVREEAIVLQHVNANYAGAGQPDWFLPAMNAALEPLKQNIQNVQHDIQGIQNTQHDIQQGIQNVQNVLEGQIRAQNLQNIARVENCKLNAGDQLRSLPDFAGNNVPNFPEHGRSLARMTGPPINALLNAYGLPLDGTVAERRSRLASFIGVSHLV
eukprot:CAMPEP_0181293206 /NCGR_PEP_ID=MMETSP1101-20121128/2940_1 /TAXON_ID=46948 /ORGANISM="Rhodomonas abbreviata, Strain Caron Lab Isolate" /LENGTH=225 /DNA_ID=CAMNT_0023397775 /DNA_START=30 /DNA_END=707 /DNA_ORIENTATION=+